MRHPQRLLLTLAALITVSSCKSEAPKPPPPKVQAVSTQLAEFTEGVDTVSTLEASNLVELAEGRPACSPSLVQNKAEAHVEVPTGSRRVSPPRQPVLKSSKVSW